MAGEKNFNIKNGLSIGGVEVIDSSGNIAAGGVGAAVEEAIADKIGGILQGGDNVTVTYDDSADTITVSSTQKTSEEIQDIVGAMMSGNTESGITVAYEDGDGTVDFTVSLSSFDTDALSEGSSNLYYTDARADARITNALIDEDNMASDSAVKLPSQQSVKAYVDGQTTDETAEGSSNLYYTDARVRSELTSLAGSIIPSADITYDLGSASKQWRDVFVGPGSLYVNGQQVVSDNSGTITISADADQNVSVQTSGSGDVDLDPTGTGVIGLKGPVQVTAGSNISSSDGNAISFSNSIDVDAIESRTADTNLTLSANGTGIVTVNDALTVTGNLIVSGTTTTVNSETISLADNIIVLNSNFTSGTPSEDTGFSVLRGGSATKSFVWDESDDKWSVGSETMVAGTFEGNLTGNVTGTTSGNAGSATVLETARTISLGGDVSGSASFDGSANISITATIADDSHNHTIANVDGLQTALNTKYESGSNVSLGTIASGAITITNATNAGGTARNMYQSTSAPASGDGAVGDMWILYS